MDTEKISNVSLVEPAYPPLKPVSPKIMLNLLVACILGLFGGLWLSFFSHYVGDKIETAEDVERALKIPVLTSIPEHG
jgi:capsular polysaccharide biosynthesis protein